MSTPAPRAGARLAHAVVLATVVAHTLVLWGTDGAARTWITLTASLVPALAVADALRRRRVLERASWAWVAAGLVLLVVHNVAGLRPGTDLWLPGTVRTFAMPVAYLLILVAVVRLMRQANRHDPGAIVDAAIIALGTSLTAWVLVVDPLLDPGLADGARVRTMILVVVCGAIGGALSQAVALLPHRRGSMLYMVAALVAASAGVVARNLTITPELPRGAAWAQLLWVLAYALIAGSVLHPSVDAEPDVDRPVAPARRLSQGRILLLGLALAVGPTTALVQAFAATSRTPEAFVAATTVVMVLLVVLRITGLAQQHDVAQGRLAHLAEHDTLTDLPNRRSFGRRLDALLARVGDGTAPGAVVLLCDLDDFKQVNDRHGHGVGDDLLREVAARLRGSVRTTGDTDDVVARLAGDEFVVVLSADPAAADGAAQRVRTAVEQPVDVRGVRLLPRLSIGAATVAPGELASGEHVLHAADEQMYADKRGRRPADAVAVGRLDRAPAPPMSTA